MAAESSLGGGEIAGILTAASAVLFGVGKGIVWLFTSRGKREQWIDEAVKRHTEDLTARVAKLEREKAELVGGFLMLAGEVQRLDPSSDILKLAHRYLVAAFPVAGGPMPDMIADLMDTLRAKGVTP